jgi:hypothetical protein
MFPSNNNIINVENSVENSVESNEIVFTENSFKDTDTDTDTDTDSISDNIPIILSMSCDIFWKYEFTILVDRTQFSRKYTNLSEDIAFKLLSQFLCFHMKKYIHDCLILEGRPYMLSILHDVFTRSHIHGHTSYHILYPNDTHTKIFICTHS